MYTAIIADDEPLERKGLQLLLTKEFPEITVVAQAASGGELIELVQKHEPDIAFVDIQMPGLSGLEAIRVLRTQELATRFVIMTAYGDFEYARKSVGLHVEAYLLKPSRREVTVRTIQEVCQKIDAGQRQSSSRKQVYELFWRVQPALEREIIYSILVGEPSVKNLETYCEMHGYLFSSGAVLWLEPCDPDQSTNELRQHLDEAADGCCTFLAGVAGGAVCMLLLLPEQVGPEEWDSYLSDVSAVLLKRLSKMSYKIRAGVSEAFESFVDSAAACNKSRAAAKTAAPGQVVFVGGQSLSQPGTSADSEENAHVRTAKQFINENYQMDISLDMLAEKIGLSACYLSRLVKQETGSTLMEYLTSVRVNKAKELAAKGELSTGEIAARVGYMNATYFCRIFKQNVGMTIGQYRESIQKIQEPSAP